jgi:hypothetical protein
MALSQMEQWLAQSHRLADHYTEITSQLSSVIAAADVLIMDKGNGEYVKMFESHESIRRAFAPLNAAQLHRLLELFSPDRVSPNPVPSQMKSAVRELEQKKDLISSFLQAQRLYECDPSEELEMPTARLLSLDPLIGR